MRLPILSLLLAALALGACDSSNYDDGYDDGYYDGQDDAPTNGATFVDFELDATDYAVSGDQRTASYQTDDIDSGTVRATVERALATAGDGALVALYIDSRLVTNIDGTSVPYAALPLSRGFEQLVVIDSYGDGSPDGSVNVVGYTASYEYSFDNQDLYFDVVSSAPASDFSADPTVLFDFVTPQRSAVNGDRQGPTRLSFRLVTVPATRGSRPAVDMTDYAAVRAAYNLPD